MVKIVYIILFLLLISCVYTGKVNDFNMPRNSQFQVEKPDNSLFSIIDTTCVYKLKNYYSHKVGNKYDIQEVTSDYVDKTLTDYYRFYRDGKLSVFINLNENKLMPFNFNPKSGYMGKYYLKNGEIYLDYYIVFEGKGKTQRYSIESKGDSLIIQLKGSFGGKILVKECIDVNLLKNQKPDW